MATVTYTNWQLIDFASTVNASFSPLDRLEQMSDSLDTGEDNLSINGSYTLISGTIGAYNVSIAGHLTGDIRNRSTSFAMETFNVSNSDESMLFEGSVKINLYTDATSGYFTRIFYQSNTNESLEFIGKMNANPSTGLASGGTISYIHIVSGDYEFTLQGNITADSNMDFSGGVITDLTITDGLGHSLTASNMSMSAKAFDKIFFASSADINAFTALVGASLADSSTLYGSSIDDTMIGGSKNDILYGYNGDDTIDGGKGADNMIGGEGDDTYIVDNMSDQITEEENEGTDLVQASVSYTLSQYVENLTLTGNASINGTGNDDANIITGNTGNNILDGGADADILIGGKGNDTYIVDNENDVVTELTNEGTDLVKTSISYTLSDNVENLTLTGSADINGIGNDLNNIITGNDGNNNLSGGLGKDTLNGGVGNDTLDGGDDIDKLVGGAGDDTYIVDLIKTGKSAASYKVALQDTITEAANAGTDTVQLRSLSGTDYSDMDNATTLTLGANLEDLDASATADIKLNLTGNALDNTLTGNDADNILDGGKGADTLIGGLGDDTYILDLKVVNGDIVFEDSITELDESDEGIDTIKLRGSATLATTTTLTLDSSRGWENIEILDASATGKTKLNLTGNILDNILIGNAAANILTGGEGDDTYVVNNIDDTVIEQDDQGTDLVQASVTFTLSDYVENLTLTGTAAINGTGNGLDNIITGNAGNNTLDGGAGADRMEGGKGNDTYIVDDEDDEVIEAANGGTDLVKASVDYELTDFVENLTLTDNDHINGTGNALANTITGNAGNNILDGGAGVDKLIGGNGDDIYIVDLIKTGKSATSYKVALQDTITEAANAGTDTVQLRLLSGTDYSDMNNATTLTLGANLENLDASGTEAIKLNLTGNALNNTLTGNDANNILDGGAGVDILQGGEGDDTYILDLKATAGILSIEDTVEEFNATTDGIDTIKLRGSVTLTEATTLSLDGSTAITWSHVENIDASATKSTKLNLTGNEFDNTLTGNAGANILDGGMGNDTLNGGAGNDTLIGGLGNDTLTGGLGADVFKWTTSDLVAPDDVSDNTDTITDFSIAQKDQIDLRDILTGASNLENYLDIVFENGSTHIRISSTGEFSDGAYDSTKEDAHIVLSNMNLFTATKTAAGNDEQLIGYLTQNNYLLTD